MSDLTSGFLLDMDGVLYRGGAMIPYADKFIENLKTASIPFLLLTNHSCFTTFDISEKLERLGIDVDPKLIYSSSIATAEELAERGVESVFVIGEKGLKNDLKDKGIALRESEASHVVVGLDREFTYDKLCQATRLIQNGAEFIATNADATYPLEDGNAPECGPLLAAISCATGKTPEIIGKPNKQIFLRAAARLELPVERLTMVGDRLDTDIVGANSAGMKSILVLTGHTTFSMANISPIKPSDIVKNLSEIILS